MPLFFQVIGHKSTTSNTLHDFLLISNIMNPNSAVPIEMAAILRYTRTLAALSIYIAIEIGYVGLRFDLFEHVSSRLESSHEIEGLRRLTC